MFQVQNVPSYQNKPHISDENIAVPSGAVSSILAILSTVAELLFYDLWLGWGYIYIYP